MAQLQKQFYRVNFGQGLDTKTDPKVLSSGKMTVLQNAQFTIANRLSKRNGFSAVGVIDATGDSIQRLDSFKNAIIGWGDPASTTMRVPGTTLYNGIPPQRSVYTYKDSLTSPTFKAQVPSFNNCLVSSQQIWTTQQYYAGQGDSCSVGGITLYAWIQSSLVTPSKTQAYYKIVNTTTGKIVVDNSPIDTNSFTDAAAIRCIAAGNSLVAGYYSPGNSKLYFTSFNTNGSGGISSTVSTTSPLAATSTSWDWATAQISGTRYLISAQIVSGTTLGFVSLNTAVTAVVSSTTTNVQTTNAAYICMVQPCPTASTTQFRCIPLDTDGKYIHFTVGKTLALGTKTQYTDGSLSTTAFNMVAQELSDMSTAYVVVGAAASLTPPVLKSQMFTYSVNISGTFIGTAASATIIRALYSVAPCSRPIYVDDNNIYLWTLFASKLQGQYILQHLTSAANLVSLVDTTNFAWFPAARILAGQAMANTIGGQVPLVPTNINYLGSNKYDTSCTVIGQQSTIGGTFSQLPAISNLHADFNYTDLFHTATLNNQMVVGGGFPALYDGSSMVELGYFMFPEGASAVASTTNGGMTAGLYQYVATYEWTDNLGNLHRSETSVPLSVTTTHTVTNAVTLTLPCLGVTLKQAEWNNRTHCNIAVYRTTVNASPAIFYRVDAGATVNSLTTATVSFVDTAADAAITANSILYTQGGVLDNYTIDGTSVIAANSTQLFAADPNNNGMIHIGKNYTPTVGLAFFSGITALLPDADGPITAMLWMNSNLVIFKARSIYYTGGIGPTDNGQNNQLSQIQLLTNQVGCDGPHAACLFPGGIMFKSAKGYYVLGNDLSFSPDTNYIGASVESYNSSSCLRAICVPDLNVCRFALSDYTTILEYNYFFHQWGATLTSVNDMAVLGGSFYLASHTPSIGALVGLETVGTFVDALMSPTGIPYTITTGWLALNQLQGAQRIFRIRFLGDFKSTHTITIELNYDYEASFAETHTLTSANITTGSSAYQFEVFPLRQKCESIQVRIKDSSPTGESFDLTDMEVEVGLLPGRRFPLAAAKGN